MILETSTVMSSISLSSRLRYLKKNDIQIYEIFVFFLLGPRNDFPKVALNGLEIGFPTREQRSKCCASPPSAHPTKQSSLDSGRCPVPSFAV